MPWWWLGTFDPRNCSSKQWWWTRPICFHKPAHILDGFVCQGWELGTTFFQCPCQMPLITPAALEAHSVLWRTGAWQRLRPSREKVMGLVLQLLGAGQPFIFHTQLAHHSFSQEYQGVQIRGRRQPDHCQPLEIHFLQPFELPTDRHYLERSKNKHHHQVSFWFWNDPGWWCCPEASMGLQRRWRIQVLFLVQECKGFRNHWSQYAFQHHQVQPIGPSQWPRCSPVICHLA